MIQYPVAFILLPISGIGALALILPMFVFLCFRVSHIQTEVKTWICFCTFHCPAYFFFFLLCWLFTHTCYAFLFNWIRRTFCTQTLCIQSITFMFLEERIRPFFRITERYDMQNSCVLFFCYPCCLSSQLPALILIGLTFLTSSLQVSKKTLWEETGVA